MYCERLHDVTSNPEDMYKYKQEAKHKHRCAALPSAPPIVRVFGHNKGEC